MVSVSNETKRPSNAIVGIEPLNCGGYRELLDCGHSIEHGNGPGSHFVDLMAAERFVKGADGAGFRPHPTRWVQTGCCAQCPQVRSDG